MGIVSTRVRKQVYRKCDGRCAYCGKPIEFSQMQVDHLAPTYWNWSDEECIKNNVTRGTDHIENLMPTCRRCNKWKDVHDIEVFRQQIFKQFEILVRDNTGYKLLLDFGLIAPTGKQPVFYYETMYGFNKVTQRTTA
jgi:hypothetical protein